MYSSLFQQIAGFFLGNAESSTSRSEMLHVKSVPITHAQSTHQIVTSF